MERGYINIKNVFDSVPSVEVKLVDGTLWLTKYQIADLFDVFTNTIGNNIRAIFKSKIIWEQDVCRAEACIDNKGNAYYSELYNLEVLLFLSYRINSANTKLFREWIYQAIKDAQKKGQRNDIVLVFNKDTVCGTA